MARTSTKVRTYTSLDATLEDLPGWKARFVGYYGYEIHSPEGEYMGQYSAASHIASVTGDGKNGLLYKHQQICADVYQALRFVFLMTQDKNEKS